MAPGKGRRLTKKSSRLNRSKNRKRRIDKRKGSYNKSKLNNRKRVSNVGVSNTSRNNYEGASNQSKVNNNSKVTAMDRANLFKKGNMSNKEFVKRAWNVSRVGWLLPGGFARFLLFGIVLILPVIAFFLMVSAAVVILAGATSATLNANPELIGGEEGVIIGDGSSGSSGGGNRDLNVPANLRGKFLFNTEDVITSLYGPRSGRMHHGIDIAPAGGGRNPDIYPIYPGVVHKVTSQRGGGGLTGWGHYIVLKHDVDGDIYYSLYAHLKDSGNVREGEQVGYNTVIGTMGTTGTSSGVHLHLEIYNETYPSKEGTMDPLDILTCDANGGMPKKKQESIKHCLDYRNSQLN